MHSSAGPDDPDQDPTSGRDPGETGLADVGLVALNRYLVNADGSRTQVSLQDAGGSNTNVQFRYDSGIGGYIFNLSTKGLGAGTYVFDWMAGDDPTTHELGFKLV
jgi:hypothetical protein